jgi:hypothetical protein
MFLSFIGQPKLTMSNSGPRFTFCSCYPIVQIVALGGLLLLETYIMASKNDDERMLELTVTKDVVL